MIKVLLVEDDENLNYIIKGSLEDMIGGYNVMPVLNGKEGLKAWKEFKPDIIVSDVEMPLMDGNEMVQIIRETDGDTPIVFATAKGSPKDVTIGYHSGVNNYIKKPFLPEELDAHIQALLKLKNGVRSRNEKNIFTLGNYHFDAERLVLQFDSKQWNLTAREAQILQLLCENRGEIVKRDDILENIWGTSDFYTSRSLDVFIKKLRTYLSADPSISIRTVKCVGLILS